MALAGLLTPLGTSEGGRGNANGNGGRFNNSTLDAALPKLALYAPLNEASGVFRNQAPYGPVCYGSPESGEASIIYGATGVLSGGCLELDSTTDCVRGWFGAAQAPASASFIWSFWYRPTDADSPTSNVYIATVGDMTIAGTSGFDIQCDTNGALLWVLGGGTNITDATPMADTTWYHIALRRFNNAGTVTWSLYKNGASVGTSTTSSTLHIPNFYPICLGNKNGSNVATVNPGRYQQLTWWNDGDEAIITALYNSGAGRALS